MRAAIDEHTPGSPPDRSLIEARIGPLVSPPAEGRAPRRTRRNAEQPAS
jgi:hypothetical protein